MEPSIKSLDDFSLSRWVFDNPRSIWQHFWVNRPFVAVHKDFGVCISAQTEDEFQARLADKRPSTLKQLKQTCVSFFVIIDDASA